MPTKPIYAINNPEILLKRIQTSFPQLTWLEYQYINHGWDHEIIILDKKLVFRFPNSQEYLTAFKDETHLLSFLNGKTKIRIPNYLYIAKDYSFGGYLMIQGTELTEPLFDALTSSDKTIIAKQIAQFLSDLHTISKEEIEHYHISLEKPFDGYAGLEKDSEIYLKTRLTPLEYDSMRKVFSDIAQIEMQNKVSVLTHGDFSPRHIIWNATTKQIGIIDFSDRSFADQSIDFAELYSYGSHFVEQIYNCYTGPKDPEFLERVRLYQKRVGIFFLVDSFRTKKIDYKEAKKFSIKPSNSNFFTVPLSERLRFF